MLIVLCIISCYIIEFDLIFHLFSFWDYNGISSLLSYLHAPQLPNHCSFSNFWPLFLSIVGTCICIYTNISSHNLCNLNGTSCVKSPSANHLVFENEWPVLIFIMAFSNNVCFGWFLFPLFCPILWTHVTHSHSPSSFPLSCHLCSVAPCHLLSQLLFSYMLFTIITVTTLSYKLESIMSCNSHVKNNMEIFLSMRKVY